MKTRLGRHHVFTLLGMLAVVGCHTSGIASKPAPPQTTEQTVTLIVDGMT